MRRRSIQLGGPSAPRGSVPGWGASRPRYRLDLAAAPASELLHELARARRSAALENRLCAVARRTAAEARAAAADPSWNRGRGPGGAFGKARTQALGASRALPVAPRRGADRKSTRLNSSHSQISYAVFCLKKKKNHSS